jgi:hypothetical protein
MKYRAAFGGNHDIAPIILSLDSAEPQTHREAVVL